MYFNVDFVFSLFTLCLVERKHIDANLEEIFLSLEYSSIVLPTPSRG